MSPPRRPSSSAGTCPQRTAFARDHTLRIELRLFLTSCLALLLLCAPGCRSTPPASFPGPVTFRVMTYNIHHGEGVDGKLDLQRIADVIQREQADIVALQEVDKGVARTGGRDLTAELAQLTGMTGVFSNNFHYQGGEYGNGVLTRFPVLSWTNHHYWMIRQGEQRGLLQLLLDVHGTEVVFMNTHIDYREDDTERLMNVEEIKTAAVAALVKARTIPTTSRSTDSHRRLHNSDAEVPIIICGDFNAPPGSRTHERMKDQFRDAWEEAGTGDGFTFPGTRPVRRIDYIWLSKNGLLRTLRIWVPETQASDHLPVVAEMELVEASSP